MKKGMLAIALIALILCTVVAPTACAEYSYTVRVFAGENGTVNGENFAEFTVNYNEGLNLNEVVEAKAKSGSEYYFKGYKISGQDVSGKSAEYFPPYFKVEKDIDLVVAYGIKGETVDYTIQYVDENNKELLPPETLTGNVGDKPIVACRFIDNYVPDIGNETKTLSNNSADNVFTFTYKPAKQGTEYFLNYQEYEEELVPPTYDTTYDISQEPQMLYDLDEEDVPLGSGMTTAVKAAYALAICAALFGTGVIIYAILENREKKKKA